MSLSSGLNETCLRETNKAVLGCSDVDLHIPKARVLGSAEILRGLGGDVTAQLYPGMGHTINLAETRFVQAMMATILAR